MIKTLAKYKDHIMFADENGFRYFIDILSGKMERTEVPHEAVITKYDYDEYMKDYESVEQLLKSEKNANDIANSIEEVFGIHPSTKLKELYKQKYWQGQVPAKAKILFLGLDANWDKYIETNEAFLYIEEYLNNGVVFWKKYGIHHPFLLPEYRKKGGYKYHQRFSKLGISKEYADDISFVELVKVPTFGTSTKGKKEYQSLIDTDYIKHLNDIIFDDRNKIVFLSRTLYEDILKIKKKIHGLNIFNFGLSIDDKVKCTNRMINIHNTGNTFIFITTHFSGNIANEHIADIATTIKSFLERKEKKWWKVSFAGSWNGELVKENRYVLAKDIFEVKEVLCKHLNLYRVERDFAELEFKPTTEDNVDRQWVWE